MTTVHPLPAPLPRVIELAIEKLSPGWRHKVTHGTGAVTKKPTDPDTRKQIEVQLDVRSAALRMRHHDGRAALAMWVATYVPEHEVPEQVIAAKWVERKATKRMGARSVHVPGKVIPAELVPGAWAYSFEQAFTWQVCTDQQCPRSGTDHSADLPTQLNATELAAFIATPAAVQELEIAA